MVSQDFRRQLEGYGLTTANILYRRPDHPWLLQSYVWQNYDLCPAFPALNKFLNFWLETLEGPLHSVTVAHARLIIRTHRSLDKDAPAFRSVQRVGTITSYTILGGLHHHYVRV